uniref:Zinc finger protein RFP-like n=1 Tax=Gopherus agassizii TaxID=38772 RepID=A0A452HVU5_9SAUR
MPDGSPSSHPVESLQGEVTCPVCLDYFTEPVTLECGHNFCRACISQCWEGSDTAASCPQCRETVQRGNLRPNLQLGNMVEIAKWLSLRAAKGAGGDRVCGEHLEALKLFCEEDQTPICVVCDRSRAHRAHTVVPIQEAAQEYKKQTQTERQKIVSEFQQLQQFLEEQERLLLAQLENLDKEIVKIWNENVSKLSAQIFHLSELISEMEGKCQKPTTPPACCNQLFHCVREMLGERGRSREGVLNVTLDPDTAHPNLVLSENWKSVTRGDTRQQLPNTPERFDTKPCVLGCEGFTSGRHCWEVEVGGGGGWAVGVARESVRRKGWISCSPDGGIWAVGWLGDQFWALTSPENPLPRRRIPSRIRVCLDCDQGQVIFIDAGDEAPIFTFPPGSIPGGRIRPWLWVRGTGKYPCQGDQPEAARWEIIHSGVKREQP